MIPCFDSQELFETIKYEHPMDGFRMLALHIADNPEHSETVFNCIQKNSNMLALDIFNLSYITDQSINSINGEIDTLQKAWLIEPGLREIARKRQLHAGKGFSYMMNHIGQMPSIAESISMNPPDFIISAGMSGCVIGEYLGLLLDKPVNHMVFERDGQQPSAGILSSKFQPDGQHCLIVEDTVMECRTLTVMLRKLKKYRSDLKFSLFALYIDNYDSRLTEFLSSNFERVLIIED